jgi:hypothetical protein
MGKEEEGQLTDERNRGFERRPGSQKRPGFGHLDLAWNQGIESTGYSCFLSVHMRG